SPVPFSVKNIEIVPDATNTLLSVWQFVNEGFDVWFDHCQMSVNVGHMDASARNEVRATGSGNRGIFRLSLASTNPNEKAFLGAGLPSRKDAHLWHAWFMHTGYQHLERTSKGVVGMKIHSEITRDVHCDACIMGKMHIRPYRPAETKSAKILAHVSFDL